MRNQVCSLRRCGPDRVEIMTNYHAAVPRGDPENNAHTLDLYRRSTENESPLSVVCRRSD